MDKQEWITAHQSEGLHSLLQSSRSGPYRFLGDELAPQCTALWLDEIVALSGQENSAVLATWRDGRPIGMVACSDLPWDTRVLGRSMGAIKHLVVAGDLPDSAQVAARLLMQAERWAVSHRLEFLLCKVYSDDVAIIHALEQAGFLLTDALLDYVYDLRRNSPASMTEPPLVDLSIRLAGSEDEEALVALAHVAFQNHFGRYHADPRITSAQAICIYEEWMRSSCRGYADWILVAESGGRIAGCSVWKKPSPAEQTLSVRVGHYSIGLVHPDWSGRGLFTALTYAGMQRFAGVAECIEGPTHINNYPVQRGYAKLHWRICDARFSFHKWLVV